MKVSFSSIQTYLTCPARYGYKYRDGLRMIKPQTHFEIGSIIHAAFEPILTAHWLGQSLPSAESAVREGCKILREKKGLTLDSEEHAQIAVRALDWHVPRMRLDLWETLTFGDKPAVELQLEVPFGNDTTLQAHIDWIARSRVTQRVYCIDHKTTKHRLGDLAMTEFDLQLALYRHACMLVGIDVDQSLLHQICYTPPDDIEPLKRPKKGARRFSVAKNQRTDWETYQNALIRHGEDPDLYQDVHELLDDQCSKSPFRRWSPDRTTQDGHDKLIEIAIHAVDNMRDIKYDNGPALPNRVNEWTCGKCDLRSWCDARMLSLDPRSLLRSVYQTDDDSKYAEEFTTDTAALRLHTQRVSRMDRYDAHGFSPHTP